MTTIALILALAGAWLVSDGRPRRALWANALWIPANAIWLVHAAGLGEWTMAIQFGVFTGLAMKGVWKWKSR